MDRLLSYLNSLDDDYYFFVANTVLGKVKTPFHKPVLNNAILSFLLNPENRANILSGLSRSDRAYISLLRMVGSATASQIAGIFDTVSFPLVLTALESLRDRLILIREGELYLENPVLDDILRQAQDWDLVLGENGGLGERSPHVDRNVLFSVLNLLSNGSVPPREANAHHFTKSDRLLKVFPQFRKDASLSFFSALKALLVSKKAVRPADGLFSIDPERAKAILDLDDLNLFIAAVGEHFGVAIERFLSVLRSHSMDRGKALSLMEIFAGEENSQRILSEMESFGLALTDEKNCVRLNPLMLEKSAPRSPLNVDSDFEVTYFGVPQSSDILYLFANVVVCDNLVRYRITKDSFLRALGLGLDQSRISSYLGTDAYSGQFSIWTSAFSRISLYDGIVICCDAQVASMVTRHPKISEHIIARPNETTFVMDRQSEWQEALSYALDLSRLPSALGDNENHGIPQPIVETGFSIAEPEKAPEKRDWDDGKALKESLIADAESKGCLTDNLRALINASLIVSKSQIGKDFRYASMQTIGGFDYSAKLSAIRNLLRKKNPPLLNLELADSTMLVQPVELMKGDGILKVRVLPQGLERSIAVSSIFKATVMRWTLS